VGLGEIEKPDGERRANRRNTMGNIVNSVCQALRHIAMHMGPYGAAQGSESFINEVVSK